MKRQVNNVKKIWMKAFLIGSCFTFVTTNGALANTEGELIQTMEEGNSVQGFPGYESEALMTKHQEIDQYVFGQKNGDFSDIGFKVTHTGPINDVIEIGIHPYEEKNAEHLYELFGKENVKVVEGTEATTLEHSVTSMDTPVSSTSTNTVVDIAASEEVANAEILSIVDSETANKTSMPLIILTVLALIGLGIYLIKRRMKVQR